MEHDKNPEAPKPTEIQDLPELLGFIETPELGQLRDKVIQAATAGDNEKRIELLTRYELLGQVVVDQYSEREQYVKAQIGMTIQTGLIRRTAGVDYRKDLEDASEHAWQERLDNLVAILDEAIENK